MCLTGSAHRAPKMLLPRPGGWRLSSCFLTALLPFSQLSCLSALCHPVPQQRGPPPDSRLLAFPDSRTMRNQSTSFTSDPVPGTDGKELAEQSIMQTHDCRVQRPASCCQQPLAALGILHCFPRSRFRSLLKAWVYTILAPGSVFWRLGHNNLPRASVFLKQLFLLELRFLEYSGNAVLVTFACKYSDAPCPRLN